MKAIKSLLTIFLIFNILNGVASAQSLEEEVKVLTRSLESNLRLIASGKKQSTEATQIVIESFILPKIDTKYFSYKVLGKHLKSLSKEQRVEFTSLLTDSMVKNYISVLKHYNNESLTVENIRKPQTGKIAKTTIKVSGEGKDKKLVLAWRFYEESNSWLIFDLEAEGVSLLQSKQKEISYLINKSGVESTLALLREKATS